MRVVAIVLTFLAACSSSSTNGPSGEPSPEDPYVPSGVDAGVIADGAAPKATLSPTYKDYAINHVILAGQSNALGNDAKEILSSKQNYGNLSFDTGVIPVADCDKFCTTYQTPHGLVPLVEGDKYFEFAVETPSSGLANQAARIASDTFGLPHALLMTNIARSGTTYWCLSKGGCNYQTTGVLRSFTQLSSDVANAKTFATAQGKSYVVRAVATIHGESDDVGYAYDHPEFPLPNGGPVDYRAALLQWQSDLESTVQGITQQTEPVPMFISQISGWYRITTSKVAQFQLDAHVSAPGKVILIGPSYFYEINPDDCLHYTSYATRRIGEYFGKVYSKVVLEGQTWEPVRPKSVTRAGNVITVQFFVPKPPLVVDTTLVQEAPDKGFTLTDEGGAKITNVAVTTPDTVTITLDKAPTKASLSYAQNQPHPAVPPDGLSPPDGTCVGPHDRTSNGKSRPAGPRGNLRDSDPTPAESDQTPLYNWMVQFVTDVP